MKTAEIAIVGTGSLAKGAVNILSQYAKGSLRIAVIGRSAAKANQICSIANARAISLGASARFLPVDIANFEAKSFARVLRPLKPKVIFFSASLQSPWEAAEGENAWTKLIAKAGYGITLPLQLSLVSELCKSVAGTDVAIVNACYPDGVNVVLHKTGLPITCGIGNAAIVEAFCRSQSDVKSSDVRVIAHHGHFGPWLRDEAAQDQPRVWIKKRELDARQFCPAFGAVGEEINTVTAATAVPVLMALLTGDSLRMSIPGVQGMRGGYPFLLKKGKFKLKLPQGVTLSEAVAHNRKGEHLDGVELQSAVKFAGKAQRALSAAGFEYSQGFDFADWTKALDKMINFRERLRKKGA